jgi:hypothetical protein
MRHRREWLRGPVVLGLLSAVTALTLASPARAVRPVTKQQAKKIADQVVTKRAKELLGDTIVATAKVSIADEGTAAVTASCPAGYQALDGGATSPLFIGTTGLGYNGVLLLESGPVVTGTQATGWTSEVFHTSSVGTPPPVEVTGYAICAP